MKRLCPTQLLFAGFWGLACAIPATGALAAENSTPAINQSAARAPYSSTATEVGTLLNDPAALAILNKYVPDFVAGPEASEQTWAMTLKEMQIYVRAYKSGLLTDEKLAAIDAELAKIPR